MIKQMLEINKIYQGDSLKILKTFPNESVDSIITSPPYWNLRDYGVEEQLGLESTFFEYINKLCDIFDEVKRVLKKEGTCFVNLGDTYSGNKKGKTDNKVSQYLKNESNGINKKAVIQEKCLCQIPSRFAIEMTNRGWILRNRLIWHKPNAMPSSASDRFTIDYEDVFFFVKNKKYYFEQILEPYTTTINRWGGETIKAYKGKYTKEDGEKFNSPRARNSRIGYPERERSLRANQEGKNKRAVWSISTKPYSEAHFATFPEKLIEPMIKSGCPEKGIVLDPFMGAGTTAVVAKKLNRNYVGIELNKNYCDIAEQRIKNLPNKLF